MLILFQNHVLRLSTVRREPMVTTKPKFVILPVQVINIKILSLKAVKIVLSIVLFAPIVLIVAHVILVLSFLALINHAIPIVIPHIFSHMMDHVFPVAQMDHIPIIRK